MRRVSEQRAFAVVQSATDTVQKVRSLLKSLGDTDESTPLAARFHRTTERLERIGLDEVSADLHSQLTLTMHDLNLLLSEHFYPGD